MILPYCIVADSGVSPPVTGVREMAVEEMACRGLRCFYSKFQQRPENFTQEDAVDFYKVVQTVFEKAAVIPFRFPTMLEAKAQLDEFVQEKAQDYAAALERLSNFVQMELRIMPAATADTPSTSGKEYMAQRLKNKQELESAANTARSMLADIRLDWRQQETREGLRCYALVARNAVKPFQEKARTLAFAREIKVSVSGPWPATEFIE